MKYEVPIIYRGQRSFIVEANSPEEARRIAEAKHKGGEKGDELGNEWEEIERIAEPSPVE